MPEISIIVPIYNVAQYLHKCVDSILAQTFTDFEVILVDDGATDNSGAICDAYAEQDSRVKVIHKVNVWRCMLSCFCIKTISSSIVCVGASMIQDICS